MITVYVYVKDNQIVSDACVLIDVEHDSVHELDVDETQSFSYLLDSENIPYVQYNSLEPSE